MKQGLPEAFVQAMEARLGAEMPAFLASYDEERLYGLRVNTWKVPVQAFLALSELELRPVPWAESGFYYKDGDRPGKHPHYHAGLYYIQEPSAMAPAELLDVRPGDRVLDLCAAPGGKTTQLASRLQGEGLLVANDVHPDRVKALVKNIELSGIRNAVVLNEDPEKLEGPFEGFFDKILVDTPCSGEGMFRKEVEMAKAWRPDWPERYAAMQRVLLRQAARMLKPGGTLAYSTCTFSQEENEAMIAEFLDANPWFEVVPVGGSAVHQEFAPGRPDWLPAGYARGAETAGTARLWPHRLQGEGHYAAVLRHRGSVGGGTPAAAEPERGLRVEPLRPREARPARKGAGRAGAAAPAADPLEALGRFAAEQLAAGPYSGAAVVWRGEHAYAAPKALPELDGIRVIRPGWYLGSVAKQRFVPSHALAMGLRASDALRSVSFAAANPRTVKYLKGETLELAADELHIAQEGIQPKGFVLVCVDGFPVGWGRWQDGLLKNDYPPGWRWT
ncbi:RsmB/NOP family class I SAM-dependent RNA methyltransferase [Paenibacillus filicis]|uniref:RsmB/NOP family class I SAM-dependent RNA methyltransferase n=1 Tax=Paenibacillus gyeongsangnamensis TaxID=3388067 RepID=A0ABT4Q5L9_9BACL|nr:RsmB/NOP family class I SAM-dependent RNA methyltransferase [Paenibacillus filicis]MCZ8512113.1 RsmB/NOP family class I SAM-dependent RNA methyltransferase [Paenibacillus filicis]